MKKLFIIGLFAVVTIVSMFYSSHGWTENAGNKESTALQKDHQSKKSALFMSDPEWESFKLQFGNLWSGASNGDQKSCQALWDTLWSESKKGNLDARRELVSLTYDTFDSLRIILPGRSGDELSSLRDSVIFSVHSSGVHYADKNAQDNYNG